MNFIGTACNFNNQLKELINDIDYTVVSYVNGPFIIAPIVENLIQILPVDNTNQYYDSMNKGFSKMAENYVEKTNVCTNIYLYMHEHIDVTDVAEIINTFDKDNLVDHIFVYPKVPPKQLRNNEVKDLPWQRKMNEISS